jgi:hypothetical protein
MKVIRKWKRWLAVSCSHGHLANAAACKAALEMKRRWQPDADSILHLGDFVDLSGLMGSARKDPDSPERPHQSVRTSMLALISFENWRHVTSLRETMSTA